MSFQVQSSLSELFSVRSETLCLGFWGRVGLFMYGYMNVSFQLESNFHISNFAWEHFIYVEINWWKRVCLPFTSNKLLSFMTAKPSCECDGELGVRQVGRWRNMHESCLTSTWMKTFPIKTNFIQIGSMALLISWWWLKGSYTQKSNHPSVCCNSLMNINNKHRIQGIFFLFHILLIWLVAEWLDWFSCLLYCCSGSGEIVYVKCRAETIEFRPGTESAVCELIKLNFKYLWMRYTVSRIYRNEFYLIRY